MDPLSLSLLSGLAASMLGTILSTKNLWKFLKNKIKNNVLVLGPPASGKTSLIFNIVDTNKSLTSTSFISSRSLVSYEGANINFIDYHGELPIYELLKRLKKKKLQILLIVLDPSNIQTNTTWIKKCKKDLDEFNALGKFTKIVIFLNSKDSAKETPRETLDLVEDITFIFQDTQNKIIAGNIKKRLGISELLTTLGVISKPNRANASNAKNHATD